MIKPHPLLCAFMLLMAASRTEAELLVAGGPVLGSFPIGIFGSTGDFIGTFSSGVGFKSQMAASPDGTIYAISGSSVLRVPLGGPPEVVAHVASLGFVDLVFGADGDLYVVSNLDTRIFRFDGTSFELIQESVLNVGDTYSLERGPDGRVYVSYFSGIGVFDPDAGVVLPWSDPVPTVPFALKLGPDDVFNLLLGDGSVLRFDTADGSLLSSFALPDDQGRLDLAVSPDNVLYVTAQTGVESYDPLTGAFLGSFPTAVLGSNQSFALAWRDFATVEIPTASHLGYALLIAALALAGVITLRAVR